MILLGSHFLTTQPVVFVLTPHHVSCVVGSVCVFNVLRALSPFFFAHERATAGVWEVSRRSLFHPRSFLTLTYRHALRSSDEVDGARGHLGACVVLALLVGSRED